MEITIEKRTCRNCGATFKVMEKSTQHVCSEACLKYGPLAPGALLRRTRKEKLETEKDTIVVNPNPVISPILKANPYYEDIGQSRLKRLRGKDQDSTTLGTKQDLTNKELKEPNKTEGRKMNELEGITGKTEQNGLATRSEGGTLVTQPEPSEDWKNNFEKVSLDSMTLLKESANKLKNLMDKAVTNTELDRVNDGVAIVPQHRAELVLGCARGIAHTIQTQINILKEINKMKGH